MKIVLIGAPGSGKGTQAEKISTKLDIPTISTGEIIRHAMRNETPMGLKVKSYMDKGMLVPDDVVIEIVQHRISEDDCVNGYILDGFPRTINQAQIGDKLNIHIDKVLNIEVSDEEIIKRISGRRQCIECGSTYHIHYKLPVKEGQCDRCGGKLVVRDDDTKEMTEKRLGVYHERTEPLIKFYAHKGLLTIVHGHKSVEETTEEVFKVLGVL
jgi:adenylate kinase